MDKLIENFKLKLDKIINLLDLTSEKETVTKNLYAALLMKVTKNLSGNVKAKQILDSTTTDQEIIQRLQELFELNDADIQKSLSDSVAETLNEFVTELKTTLPSEKVEELNKIVSE